jgi:hypothetical protein
VTGRVLPFDEAAAGVHADVRAMAARTGTAIGDSDGYVAATARANDLTVAGHRAFSGRRRQGDQSVGSDARTMSNLSCVAKPGRARRRDQASPDTRPIVSG